MPGVKLNFSKKGMSSISFGGKGGRVTFGSKRTTTTIGIPGTGLRYQTSKSYGSKRSITKSTVAPYQPTHSYSSNTSYSSSASNDDLKAQWGCGFLLLGVFFFLGFLLIGHQPDWAFGSLGVGATLFYVLLHGGHIKEYFEKRKRHKEIIKHSRELKREYEKVREQNSLEEDLKNKKKEELYSRISPQTIKDLSQLDPLFIEVMLYCFVNNTFTVSAIRRKFDLGFARSQHILDLAERSGIISPSINNNLRTPLVSIDDLPLALDSICLNL